MAQALFRRYLWLYETIIDSDGVTFDDINEKWQRSAINDTREPLPKQTFRNHLLAISEMFNVDIVCDRKDGYRYKIEDADNTSVIDESIRSLVNLKMAVADDKSLAKKIIIPDFFANSDFRCLLQAMKESKYILVAYRRDDEEIIVNKAQPLALRFAFTWYACLAFWYKDVVEGWTPVMVRLNNIFSIEIVDETFEPWDIAPEDIIQFYKSDNELKESDKELDETIAWNMRNDGIPCDEDLFAKDIRMYPKLLL